MATDIISASQPASTTLVKTATMFMNVFTILDPSTISAIQSDKYEHVFAPASMNPPQPKTRETFAAHLDHLREIMHSFPVRSKQVWPNPSLNQVVIWADSEAEFHQHVKDGGDDEDWSFRGEYMFVLTMDESGEKVEHVLEFLDSKATERGRLVMARAFRKIGKEIN